MKRFFIALIVALFSLPTFADDPARLAPADAGVLIEIRDIPNLLKQWPNDPFLKMVTKNLPSEGDPDTWAFIQEALDMDGTQILETYFGQQIVVIAEKPGDGEPSVIFSRIDAKDVARVIDGLVLLKIDRIGGFDIYEPEDRSSRFAFSDQWMVFCDQWHENYLRYVIESIGEGGHLAGDKTYLQAVAKLPADRDATVFLREGSDVHVLGMTSRAEDFTLNYAGTSSRFAPLLSKLGSSKSLGFGPAPDDALMAATLNVYDPNPRNTIVIDRLITPHTFKDDVLPGLGAPLVMWMSASNADADDQTPAPVFGVAVRVTDDNVTQLMDQAMQSLMMLANVMGIQWGLPPITTTSQSHQGQTFHVTDTGVALAQRTQVDALKHLNLAFGQTNHWYTITTSDASFRQCLDDVDRSVAKSNSDRQPILQIKMRSHAMSQQVQDWVEYLADQVPSSLQFDAAQMTQLAEILSHYQTMHLSLETDAEGIVYGSLDVTR